MNRKECVISKHLQETINCQALLSRTEFREITNEIIAGAFTGKLIVLPEGVRVRSSLSVNFVKRWKNMSDEISEKCPLSDDICCYRAVRKLKNVGVGTIIPHPIPASATFSKRIASDWLGEEDGLFLIHIPKFTKITCLDKFDERESELVIPSCELHVKDIVHTRINGRKKILYITDLVPKSYTYDSGKVIVLKSPWKPKFRKNKLKNFEN